MEKAGNHEVNTDTQNENGGNTTSDGAIAKRKRRSTAWDHFHIVSGTVKGNSVEFAQCNYCTTKYQYSGKGVNGSTGNLKNHLKKKHPDKEVNTAENLENNAEFIFSQNNYRRALLKWIVQREQHIKETQQAAFLDVVRSLNPFAEEITSSMLQQDLIELYADKAQSLKVKLSQVPGKVSFTIIVASSIKEQKFLKIKAYWIDNWKLETHLLDFCYVQDKNFISNACDLFIGCLHRYEIPLSKVLGITLQNVMENDAFINSLHNHGIAKGVNISCTANFVEPLLNIVNLSVQALLSSSNRAGDNDHNLLIDAKKDHDNQNVSAERKNDEIISVLKLRNLISAIRGSRDLQQELKEMCTLTGVEFSLPEIDEKPNLTLKMLERATQLQQPLRALCMKLETLLQFMISEAEWNELNVLKKLLHKFHRATDFVPISSYLATLKWLIDSLNTLVQDNDGCLTESIKICLTKINEYDVEITSSKIPYIATLLNPALKMEYFKEHNYSKSRMKEIEKTVHDIFKNDYEIKGNVSAEKSEEEEDEFFSHMFKRSKTEKLSKEFQKFLRYPLSSPKANILDFWKLNESEFPGLAKMARDYLGVSSSLYDFEKEKIDEEMGTTEQIRALHCLGHWLKTEN